MRASSTRKQPVRKPAHRFSEQVAFASGGPAAPAVARLARAKAPRTSSASVLCELRGKRAHGTPREPSGSGARTLGGARRPRHSPSSRRDDRSPGLMGPYPYRTWENAPWLRCLKTSMPGRRLETRLGERGSLTMQGRERTKEQLYREAKRLGVKDRSKMNKGQLKAAVDRRR